MHAHLNYLKVQYRSAGLRRAGERARLVTEVPAWRRRLSRLNTITRPSAELWRGRTTLEAERWIGGVR